MAVRLPTITDKHPEANKGIVRGEHAGAGHPTYNEHEDAGHYFSALVPGTKERSADCSVENLESSGGH
jgi:hypothetical protein